MHTSRTKRGTRALSETILTWGAVAGALSAIIALTVKIVGIVRKCKAYFKGLSDNIDTLLKHDHAQYMAILKLTIMSENIPLSERIIAGKEYTELKGNGDVKQYYEEHLKPYDKILKGE